MDIPVGAQPGSGKLNARLGQVVGLGVQLVVVTRKGLRPRGKDNRGGEHREDQHRQQDQN